MSDAVLAEQSRQLSEKDREILRLEAEAKKHRLGKRSVTEELARFKAEAEGQIAALTTERDSLQARIAAAPSEQDAEIGRLKGEIRLRDHKEAWASAREHLADKVSLEKVWQELQYTPGDEVPTPEQITEQLAKVRETAPYLLKSAEMASDASRGANGAQDWGGFPPGPGYGRGSTSHDAGFLTVRRSDTQNPDWMQANQGKVAAAVADNRVRFVD